MINVTKIWKKTLNLNVLNKLNVKIRNLKIKNIMFVKVVVKAVVNAIIKILVLSVNSDTIVKLTNQIKNVRYVLKDA